MTMAVGSSMLNKLRSMSIGHAQARKTPETHPIFRACKFCLVEKKKSLDLQIYNRIGKTKN